MSVARIYIGRLSNYARDRDVERFIKGYGRIRDIMIKNGYCFVVSIHFCCVLGVGYDHRSVKITNKVRITDR